MSCSVPSLQWKMPLYSFLAGNGMAHPVEAPGVQGAKRKLWEQPDSNMDMVEMEEDVSCIIFINHLYYYFN